MTEIVKVQIPLASNPPNSGLPLVYAKGHKHEVMQPLDHATKVAMGSNVKAFFEAEFRQGPGVWVIGKRVKDREW